MSDVGGVDRLCQGRRFSGQVVCTPANTQTKDAGDLELLPAFVAKIDDGSIESSAHALVRLAKNGRLPELGERNASVRCCS
jgi:hypothetical protein